MNGTKIIENFFMNLRQLLVQPNDSLVPLSLITLTAIGTAGAIFADVQLLGSAILISANRDIGVMCKLFPIWTDQIAIFVPLEIYGTERVIPVVRILDGLFVHREFHVLFHAVLFTVQYSGPLVKTTTEKS